MGTLGDAALQRGVRLFQRGAGVLALQRGGDVIAHEGEQFLVALGIGVLRRIALHRQHAHHFFVPHQRHAQPAYGAGAEAFDLAFGDQPVDGGAIHQQRFAVAQYVFGGATPVRARRSRAVDLVDRVGEHQLLLVAVDQRDVEVSRVQQAAHGPVHGGVEVFQAFGCVGQFGDAEQRRLQALAALALQYLLTQHAVGFAQGGGAVGDALFEVEMGAVSFQRGLHVLGHVAQQLQVALRIMDIGAIALHHDAADHPVVAYQRHAEPVLAIRAHRHEMAGELLRQFLDRSHQRATALQQVPGEAVGHVAQRNLLVGRGWFGVHRVDVIRKTDAVGGDVVQHDVEVFRIHQAAQDAVQRAHQFGHVVFGAGLLGNRVKRPLQPLRLRQPRDRVVEAAGFSQLAQPGVGDAPEPGKLCVGRVGQRCPVGQQGQCPRGLAVFSQVDTAGCGAVGGLVRRVPAQLTVDAEVRQHKLADAHDAGRVGSLEQLLERAARQVVFPEEGNGRGQTGGQRGTHQVCCESGQSRSNDERGFISVQQYGRQFQRREPPGQGLVYPWISRDVAVRWFAFFVFHGC